METFTDKTPFKKALLGGGGGPLAGLWLSSTNIKLKIYLTNHSLFDKKLQKRLEFALLVFLCS